MIEHVQAPDDVLKNIYQDLNWREDELAAMKKLLTLSDVGVPSGQALLKATLTLLYAHYEGFVKFVWDTFLEAIEKESHSRDCHIDSLAIFSLQEKLRLIKNKYNIERCFHFLKSELPVALNAPIKFPAKLDTQYNLNPDVYIEKMQILGLPYDEMTKRQHIVRSVVERRHQIAHGKTHYIADKKTYYDYEDAITSVMYEPVLNIEEALKQKRYLVSHQSIRSSGCQKLGS